MKQIADRIYTHVAIPTNWDNYLRLIDKPKVLLVSLNQRTGKCRSERLTLLRAVLTAKHRTKLPKYSNYSFYIQHL